MGQCQGPGPTSRPSRIRKLYRGQLFYDLKAWPDQVGEAREARSVWRVLNTLEGWQITTSPVDTAISRKREVRASPAHSASAHVVDAQVAK